MRSKGTEILTVEIGALEILASASYAPGADREPRSSKVITGSVEWSSTMTGPPFICAEPVQRCGGIHGFGTEVTRDLYDANPVIDIDNPRMGPQPTRDLNGQRYR